MRGGLGGEMLFGHVRFQYASGDGAERGVKNQSGREEQGLACRGWLSEQPGDFP